MRNLVGAFLSLLGSILFFSLALKYHGGFTSDVGALGGGVDRFVGTVDTMGSNQGHG
jgi:hypothetical protein